VYVRLLSVSDTTSGVIAMKVGKAKKGQNTQLTVKNLYLKGI